MNLTGTWISEDDKYTLVVHESSNGDSPIEIEMPISGKVSGVLKANEVANLKFEVNEKMVFVYLFVEAIDDKSISIKGSGRSAGRYQGNIPLTTLYRK